jgi:putative sigma-54 modulation protein
MQVHYTTQHIELTDGLKTHTEDKMAKLQQRDAAIDKVNVSLHIERGIHIAEGSLRLNGSDIHATAKADDMYAAIDSLADKLLTQITKHKEKIISHHHGEH